MKSVLKNAFIALSVMILVSCAIEQPRYERVLGTACYINLYENGTVKLYDELFDRLNEIDDEFNTHKVASVISLLNAEAYQKPISVSDDVVRVLKQALDISALTGGAYDCTIGAISGLWQIGSDDARVPVPSEISEALPFVDYKNVVLDVQSKTVQFKTAGVNLDLGSIVKGYAADEVAKICCEHNVRRAIIDLGGNVYVYGTKDRGKQWRVGVKNPEDPYAAPMISLLLPECSVVTSGGYERYLEAEDGTVYHHILSPFTGYPAESDVLSTTVVCKNSLIADGLSTAFFLLGSQKAIEALPRFEEEFSERIGLIIIRKNHTIWVSENLSGKFSLLAEDWTLER